MWGSPILMKLIPTDDSWSFKSMPAGCTGIPLLPHPGAFGARRKHHTHEGVDLYCPENTEVFSVNNGIIIDIVPFTGEFANSPWWEETSAVLVETSDGIMVYGEIVPSITINIGDQITQGILIGTVKRVLRENKGRPMSMLHLELHRIIVPGNNHHPLVEWGPNDAQPDQLLNPTQFLLNIGVDNETSNFYID